MFWGVGAGFAAVSQTKSHLQVTSAPRSAVRRLDAGPGRGMDGRWKSSVPQAALRVPRGQGRTREPGSRSASFTAPPGEGGRQVGPPGRRQGSRPALPCPSPHHLHRRSGSREPQHTGCAPRRRTRELPSQERQVAPRARLCPQTKLPVGETAQGAQHRAWADATSRGGCSDDRDERGKGRASWQREQHPHRQERRRGNGKQGPQGSVQAAPQGTSCGRGWRQGRRLRGEAQQEKGLRPRVMPVTQEACDSQQPGRCISRAGGLPGQ